MTTNKDSMSIDVESNPRIIHVGLWVVCTFVIYAIHDALRPEGQMPPGMLRVAVLFSAIRGITDGLAIAALLVLLTRRCRDNLKIVGSQPGHWIALYVAIGTSISILGHLVDRAFAVSHFAGGTFHWAIAVLIWIVHRFTRLFLAAYPIWKFRAIKSWQTFFILLVAYNLFTIVWALLGYPEASSNAHVTNIPSYLSLILIASMTYAIISDIKQKSHRGWVHYAGAASYLIQSLFDATWNLVISMYFEWLFVPPA